MKFTPQSNEGLRSGRMLHCCFMPAVRAVVFLVMTVATTSVRAADEPRLAEINGRDPAPQPAVKAIVAAFDKHDIVGLTVAHGDKDLDDFILGLIRTREFASKVNDIELECGNSLYQPLLDRYIAGEDVPLAEVREVWRTSPLPMCSQSFWQEIFPLVRQVNAKRPAGKKLRLLASEPAIDWRELKTAEEFSKYMSARDIRSTEIAEKEILARNRKGLLLFGAGHLLRGGAASSAAPLGHMMSTLEQRRPGSTYVIVDYRGFWTGTPLSKYNDALEVRRAGRTSGAESVESLLQPHPGCISWRKVCHDNHPPAVRRLSARRD